jgi:hypothetical protein
LCRICFPKHVIGGKIVQGIEVTERQGRRRKQLLEIKTGNTRSHSEKNTLWKRLQTCRETNCGKREMKNIVKYVEE